MGQKLQTKQEALESIRNDLPAEMSNVLQDAGSKQQTSQQTVNNVNVDEVIGLIFKLREKGMTYGEMERQSGINRSYIFQIFKRKFWPQKESRRKEILEALKKLTGERVNFQKEVENDKK